VRLAVLLILGDVVGPDAIVVTATSERFFEEAVAMD
jgi:hypothetical protein